MTNATTLQVCAPAEALGDLTLADIRGYTVHTRKERVDGLWNDRLHLTVRHGDRVVGTGSLRPTADDESLDVHWWGYVTVEGFNWSVSGARGSGRLEFREDKRLPKKPEWEAA